MNSRSPHAAPKTSNDTDDTWLAVTDDAGNKNNIIESPPLVVYVETCYACLSVVSNAV